jgi:hypothetical protein
MSDTGLGPTDQESELDTEGHAMSFNVNESIVSDDGDTEGHGMNLGNDNETIVVDDEPDAEDVE